MSTTPTDAALHTAVHPSSRALLRLWPLDTQQLRWLFGATLLMRLLYPFFSSPLERLFSDPARHWDNAQHFLHPGVMGSGDPYLYQVWLYALQELSGSSAPVIELASGLLCAAMPYGWYRALKELVPKRWALGGATAIGLTPSFIGFYAYFMNETLLLTLTGFAFWLSLRARRRATLGACAGAACLWAAVCLTRMVLGPIAGLTLAWIALRSPRRGLKIVCIVAIFALAAIPAGLHSRKALGFFSPFGNPYLAQIYRHSGKQNIDLDFGPQGRFGFGSPSFYNPTFYPFSAWTGGREGTASVVIDTSRGRTTWREEDARISAEATYSRWRDRGENFLYLMFGQPWPANNWHTFVGALTVWSRWLWPVLFCWVAYGFFRRRFVGREWLLPTCGLLMLGLLTVQDTGIIEGRYRVPVDPILMASLVVLLHRRCVTLQAI